MIDKIKALGEPAIITHLAFTNHNSSILASPPAGQGNCLAYV